VGRENIFIFGMNADEVVTIHANGYNPRAAYNANAELRQALDMIKGGYFSPDDPNRFRPIFDALIGQGDRYLLLADYGSYISCQEGVDELYRDPAEWARRAILNVAGMGKFSSDRTIGEYAEKIWGIRPARVVAEKSTRHDDSRSIREAR
jgi:starch phosphorylase